MGQRETDVKLFQNERRKRRRADNEQRRMLSSNGRRISNQAKLEHPRKKRL